MKTLQDIKLEAKISDILEEIAREFIDGEWEGVALNDVRDVMEAKAINIITEVRNENVSN